jgi:hypothetical protein
MRKMGRLSVQPRQSVVKSRWKMPTGAAQRENKRHEALWKKRNRGPKRAKMSGVSVAVGPTDGDDDDDAEAAAGKGACEG